MRSKGTCAGTVCWPVSCQCVCQCVLVSVCVRVCGDLLTTFIALCINHNRNWQVAATRAAPRALSCLAAAAGQTHTQILLHTHTQLGQGASFLYQLRFRFDHSSAFNCFVSLHFFFAQFANKPKFGDNPKQPQPCWPAPYAALLLPLPFCPLLPLLPLLE